MVLIIILLCAVGFIWLQSLLFRKKWNQGLSVTLSVKNTECVTGENNVLTEVITNNKWLPLPLLHVKFNTPKSFIFENEENSSVTDYYYRDDIFAIMGHQIVTRHLKFNCSKRGCYLLNDSSVTSTDLFMQSILTDKMHNQVLIHVYPKKIDISFFEIPFQTITGNCATQKTLIEDPFEFRGIREYQPYDSMRSINWKSSAKNNQLMVNTFFMTSSQNVHLLLNLDSHTYMRNERLMESIISLASSLAEKFISMGIPVSLESNAIDGFTKERLKCPSGQGVPHMVCIDTALARIDTKAENADFLKLMKQELDCMDDNAYYIVISHNRHDELVDYYRQIEDHGATSYFIVPELKEVPLEIEVPGLVKWEIDY